MKVGGQGKRFPLLIEAKMKEESSRSVVDI